MKLMSKRQRMLSRSTVIKWTAQGMLITIIGLYWEGVRVSQEIETGELICKETGLRN
jgi:hypothetical protein